nr:MAG TPA: Protein of unknown function (DUF551) [Caudoviricetes sp.]
MKIETAIERLQELIDCNEKYEAFLTEEDDNDEELRDTELTLETLRMAVRALESKLRWIPCTERLPEMHEEVDYTGRHEESDLVLICDASELHPQVHVGHCVKIEDRTWWRTREWKVLSKVTAWMPLPKAYEEK